MPEPNQPPTPQRAATAAPTGRPPARIWASLATYEGWEQGTKPERRTQHTGVVDTGR